jgi:hypothetical protein
MIDNTDSLFYKIKTKSSIRKELLEVAQSIAVWDRPMTFLSKTCPADLYLKENLFKILSPVIDEDFRKIKIFKIPAWTYYGIHTDLIRHSAFNMLLNDTSDSTSFFQNTPFKHTQCEITECVYELDHWYLFNTQVPHAVLNRGQDRYVLSVQGSEIYDVALTYVKENNL